MMRERSRADAGEWVHVYAYFEAVCHQLTRPATTPGQHPPPEANETAAAALFRLLTSRDFTYLTRKRSEPFRPSVEDYFQRAIDAGEPISLYLDIGGGYRASLQPERLPLAFAPGFGELLVLYQVRSFLQRAQPRSPVPIRFNLVVDNLCAHFVNGIPLSATGRYCAMLREVIAHFDMDVDVLVESERVSVDDYARRFEDTLANEPEPDALTPSARDNVERFLGRRVDERTALHQLARYAAGGATTEAGLARIVDGVRLTQRATPQTLAFRPFPGGDVRIQCGEIGLGAGASGRIRPLLRSSANFAQYHSERVDVADWNIPHLTTVDLLH